MIYRNKNMTYDSILERGQGMRLIYFNPHTPYWVATHGTEELI